MPKPREKPLIRRHVLLTDEDWDAILQEGPTYSQGIRELIRKKPAAKKTTPSSPKTKAK